MEGARPPNVAAVRPSAQTKLTPVDSDSEPEESLELLVSLLQPPFLQIRKMRPIKGKWLAQSLTTSKSQISQFPVEHSLHTK